MTLDRFVSAFEMIIEFKIHEVAYAYGYLTRLIARMDSGETVKQAEILDLLRAIKKLSQRLGFKSCSAHIARVTKYLQTWEHDYLKERLEELRNRMHDDLKQTFCFWVEGQYVELYKDREAFGAVVAKKYPKLSVDIEEAGRCLAMDRPTAAVFHLMRIVESGVQRFGRKLGVILTDLKVWQVILNELNAPIHAMPEKTASQKRRKQEFTQIASHLYNVKVAWRNPAMHPRALYTPEQAREIYDSTKIFVRHLTKII